MKWLRYSLWGILALVVLAAAWWFWQRSQDRNRRQVEEWLEAIVVPRFEMREQTLADGVAMLNQVIEAAPNRPAGLKIVIASEEETRKRDRRHSQALRLPHSGRRRAVPR